MKVFQAFLLVVFIGIGIATPLGSAVAQDSQSTQDTRNASSKQDTLVSEDDPFMAILREPPITRMGDLEEMKNERTIRVLTTYNKTNFFIAGGKISGFEYELLNKYEQFLNKETSRREIKTDLIFIPTTKDQLIPLLLAGKGDMVAAAMTVTPEREQQCAFTNPYLSNVDEVLITHKDVGDIKSLHDLSGRTVYVVRGSSYAEHLRELNDWAEHFNKDPIDIFEMERHFETEDLLEMVNAGIIDVTVTDKYLAELWTRILPDIVVREDIVLTPDQKLAWAVRKNNPEFLDHLNKFIRQNKKGTLTGNVLFDRYYEGTKWITNPVSTKRQGELDNLKELFQEYGAKYNFDWLGLAALAYQESGLKQNRKSHRGAIGVMQVTPTTASDMGISNIQDVRNNIHAGVKYLDWLRENYFNHPEISSQDKVDFSLAAYNAGPRRIARIRKKARELGYDPNIWFLNVEKAALRDVGQETVRYVANINKYYVAFRMAFETNKLRDNPVEK